MIKIYFAVHDPPAFLPAASESLNAELVGDSIARLKNSPIFQTGVAYGDVIEFERDADGLPWFSRIKERSDYSSIRIVRRAGNMEDLFPILEENHGARCGLFGPTRVWIRCCYCAARSVVR